jgi:hypothetical protein
MGEDLFSQVIDATGLPEDGVSQELNRLLSQAGVERSEMTLDDLRRILAEYVQDVLLAAQDEYSQAAGE